jgi:hypothetical protein
MARTICIDEHPILLEHFCHMRGESVALDIFQSAWEAAGRILSNPERFPKADIARLALVYEALFECDPSACVGI